MHDITRSVAAIVSDCGVRNCIVHVFNMGSIGVTGTIEFEPGLRGDLQEILDRLSMLGRAPACAGTCQDEAPEPSACVPV